MTRLAWQIVFQTLILFITCSVSAQSNRCEFVLDVKPKYSECYVNGACPDNIFRMLSKIQEESNDLDIKSDQVLYVYSRWTGSTIYDFNRTTFRPLITRNGKTQNWKFHVVLLRNGFVYDFEHNREIKPVAVKQYFEEMYGAGWETLGSQKKYHERSVQLFFEEEEDIPPPIEARQRLHVRAIPASVYLAEYSFERPKPFDPKVKSYAYWIYGDPRFEDQTLEAYLESNNQNIVH